MLLRHVHIYHQFIRQCWFPRGKSMAPRGNTRRAISFQHRQSPEGLAPFLTQTPRVTGGDGWGNRGNRGNCRSRGLPWPGPWVLSLLTTCGRGLTQSSELGDAPMSIKKLAFRMQGKDWEPTVAGSVREGPHCFNGFLLSLLMVRLERRQASAYWFVVYHGEQKSTNRWTYMAIDQVQPCCCFSLIILFARQILIGLIYCSVSTLGQSTGCKFT